MTGIKEGMPETDIPEEAQALWDKVFHLSNTILHQHKWFGFDEILEKAHPKVETILQLCRIFDTAFETVMEFDKLADIGYDARRQVLNARKQITTIEQLASAVQAGRQQDYEDAVKALREQAAF